MEDFFIAVCVLDGVVEGGDEFFKVLFLIIIILFLGFYTVISISSGFVEAFLELFFVVLICGRGDVHAGRHFFIIIIIGVVVVIIIAVIVIIVGGIFLVDMVEGVVYKGIFLLEF